MRERTRIPNEEAQQLARRAADRLAEDTRVRLVYLFGSAADGSAAPPRDVDLAILADPPIQLDELLRIQADLVSGTGCRLDLVSLHQASVALAHEVADHGVCLFARTSDDEIGFVTRARSRFWDFSPYLEAQWQLTEQRAETRTRGPEA
jgi:predicted nucleotidyltransferase